MAGARELIATLLDLNKTSDRSVAQFTPSLIGLFGSLAMLDQYLAHLDTALASQTISPPLKERSANLLRTFIPQVAKYNGIESLPTETVTPDQLRSLRADTLESRTQGLQLILAALQNILDEVTRIG